MFSQFQKSRDNVLQESILSQWKGIDEKGKEGKRDSIHYSICIQD